MLSIMRVPTVRGRFIRVVMGKPYLGEDLKEIWEHNFAKKEHNAEKKSTTTEKFSKSFQAYLDMVADDSKTFAPKEPVKSS